MRVITPPRRAVRAPTSLNEAAVPPWNAPTQRADAAGLPSWQFTIGVAGLIALGDPFININKIFGGDDPAPWIRWLWVGLYAVFLPLILANMAGVWRGVVRTPVLAALSFLALASALWSISGEVSARRAVGVLYWLAFAYVLAERMSWRLFVKALTLTCATLAAISYFFIIFQPSHGIMDRDVIGAWSGAWTHKNLLGANMTLSFLTALSAAWMFPQHRWKLWLLAVLSLVLVWGAMSANARASCALIAGVMLLTLLVRIGPIVATLTAAISLTTALIIGGIMLLAPEVLFSVIGRDATFTGRTEIWSHLYAAFLERPFTGYGYGAFWDDKLGPAYWIRTGLQWAVPSSHNGWVELALSLGIVAVIGFAFVYGAAMLRGALSTFHRDAGIFVPAFLVIYTFQTLFEGYVLEDNNLIYTVFTVVAVKLAMMARGEPEGATTVIKTRG